MADLSINEIEKWQLEDIVRALSRPPFPVEKRDGRRNVQGKKPARPTGALPNGSTYDEKNQVWMPKQPRQLLWIIHEKFPEPTRELKFIISPA